MNALKGDQQPIAEGEPEETAFNALACIEIRAVTHLPLAPSSAPRNRKLARQGSDETWETGLPTTPSQSRGSVKKAMITPASKTTDK